MLNVSNQWNVIPMIFGLVVDVDVQIQIDSLVHSVNKVDDGLAGDSCK